MDIEALKEKLIAVKVPPLILDQKWHRLFALGGKPEAVTAIEEKASEVLKRQGELNNELKALKKVKQDLMDSVMSNMEGAEEDKNSDSTKKLDENKRLLEEASDKLKAVEDELLDIPITIDELNKDLLIASMEFCYDKLRTNTQEAKEIADWIIETRNALKKNIIKKQNREINNKEIYAYMHDIFGPDVMDIFDMENEDFLIVNTLEHKEE